MPTEIIVRRQFRARSTQARTGRDLWQNHGLDVFYRQPNTGWHGKFLARYVFPRDIAASTNVRHQSGFPWAPVHRVSIPGSGTQPILLEDLKSNRSDNVTIVDVRLGEVLHRQRASSRQRDGRRLQLVQPESGDELRPANGKKLQYSHRRPRRANGEGGYPLAVLIQRAIGQLLASYWMVTSLSSSSVQFCTT